MSQNTNADRKMTAIDLHQHENQNSNETRGGVSIWRWKKRWMTKADGSDVPHPEAQWRSGRICYTYTLEPANGLGVRNSGHIGSGQADAATRVEGE